MDMMSVCTVPSSPHHVRGSVAVAMLDRAWHHPLSPSSPPSLRCLQSPPQRSAASGTYTLEARQNHCRPSIDFPAFGPSLRPPRSAIGHTQPHSMSGSSTSRHLARQANRWLHPGSSRDLLQTPFVSPGPAWQGVVTRPASRDEGAQPQPWVHGNISPDVILTASRPESLVHCSSTIPSPTNETPMLWLATFTSTTWSVSSDQHV